MEYKRVAYFKDVRMSDEAHGRSDDELIEEAVKEAHEADLLGYDAGRVPESIFREQIQIGPFDE